MERSEAIEQIKRACNAMGVELMKIHPAVPALKNQEAQNAIYEALYSLTREIETVKKRVGRLSASTSEEADQSDQPDL